MWIDVVVICCQPINLSLSKHDTRSSPSCRYQLRCLWLWSCRLTSPHLTSVSPCTANPTATQTPHLSLSLAPARPPSLSASHHCGPLGPSSVTMGTCLTPEQQTQQESSVAAPSYEQMVLSVLAYLSLANCWRTVKMTVTEGGDLEVCREAQVTDRLKKEEKWNYLSIQFSPEFRKNISFSKVPFVLLIRAVCR